MVNVVQVNSITITEEDLILARYIVLGIVPKK